MTALESLPEWVDENQRSDEPALVDYYSGFVVAARFAITDLPTHSWDLYGTYNTKGPDRSEPLVR